MEKPYKPGPQAMRIVHILARPECVECPRTAREIAEIAGEHHRASDWAHGKIHTLQWQGLIESAGVSFSGATTWRLTQRGWDARTKEATDAG